MVNEKEQCTDQLMVKVAQITKLIDGFKDQDQDSQSEEARRALADIQCFLDNNRALIPQYCLKIAVESMKRLQSLVDRPNAKKIQFKFKSRPKTSKPDTEAVSENSSSEIRDSNSIANKPDTTNYGFADINNRRDLCLMGDDIQFKPINLVNLSQCDVKVVNVVDTAYISGLKDCTVFILVAARAITVADCTGCNFKLVCQQLRIRSATKCKFVVYTSARSMLESSKELEFSRLNFNSLECDLSREDIEKLMTAVNFDRNKNNWNCIDDFDWLSPSVPSKNYKILEDD